MPAKITRFEQVSAKERTLFWYPFGTTVLDEFLQVLVRHVGQSAVSCSSLQLLQSEPRPPKK